MQDPAELGHVDDASINFMPYLRPRNPNLKAEPVDQPRLTYATESTSEHVPGPRRDWEHASGTSVQALLDEDYLVS